MASAQTVCVRGIVRIQKAEMQEWRELGKWVRSVKSESRQGECGPVFH